jgi:hypothetical protein
VRATAETEAKTYAFSIPYKNLPLKALSQGERVLKVLI